MKTIEQSGFIFALHSAIADLVYLVKSAVCNLSYKQQIL